MHSTDTLVLEIPIELTYQPAGPSVCRRRRGRSDFLRRSHLRRAFFAALIGAGISKVDIMSMGITSWVLGATPSMLPTSLAAGINDFDLAIDTDDNGTPGPNRLELNTVTSTLCPC